MTLNDLFSPVAAEVESGIRQSLEQADEAFVEHTGGAAVLRMLRWTMMPSAVAAHVGRLLDLQISDLLVGAWNKSLALREYLAKSTKSPEKDFFLELSEHKITSSHQPAVVVIAGGRPRVKLKFPVDVELAVRAVVLRIRNGRIAEIQPGEIKGKGTLRCGRAVLLKKELTPLKLPASMLIPRGESKGAPPGS